VSIPLALLHAVTVHSKALAEIYEVMFGAVAFVGVLEAVLKSIKRRTGKRRP
jgi:hypothetical protein